MKLFNIDGDVEQIKEITKKRLVKEFIVGEEITLQVNYNSITSRAGRKCKDIKGTIIFSNKNIFTIKNEKGVSESFRYIEILTNNIIVAGKDISYEIHK